MPPLHTGCSSAWESARVGSERPLVQIQPSQLQRRVPRGRIRREGPPVRGEGSGWVRPHRPRDPCLGPRSLAPLSLSEGVRVASVIPYPLSLPHYLTALQPPQGDISRAYSSTSHTSSPPTIKHPPWPFQSHKRSESPPLCHVNAPDCPRRHDLLKVKGGDSCELPRLSGGRIASNARRSGYVGCQPGNVNDQDNWPHGIIRARWIASGCPRVRPISFAAHQETACGD
jgi:hypothetical protein